MTASGRDCRRIPGPTKVPDRVLRAIDRPTIDHRGPEFQRLGQDVLAGLKAVFKTRGPVVIYPASGTGAWEAALSLLTMEHGIVPRSVNSDDGGSDCALAIAREPLRRTVRTVLSNSSGFGGINAALLFRAVESR